MKRVVPASEHLVSLLTELFACAADVRKVKLSRSEVRDFDDNALESTVYVGSVSSPLCV